MTASNESVENGTSQAPQSGQDENASGESRKRPAEDDPDSDGERTEQMQREMRAKKLKVRSKGILI